MKHWNTTYTFDNGGGSLHSRHAGGSTSTSDRRWSSIVDPYSIHNYSNHVNGNNGFSNGSSLHAAPINASIKASLHVTEEEPRIETSKINEDEADLVRLGPGSPRPGRRRMLSDLTASSDASDSVNADAAEQAITEGIKPVAGPLAWYAANAQSDWYGATVRMANRTPVRMLGYQSEPSGDQYDDSGKAGNCDEGESVISYGPEDARILAGGNFTDPHDEAMMVRESSLKETSNGEGRNVYADTDRADISRHDCANCTKWLGTSLSNLWPWSRANQQQQKKNSILIVDDYQKNLFATKHHNLVSTIEGVNPVAAAFVTDAAPLQHKDAPIDEGNGNVKVSPKYDANAKETQLRAEAALWANTAKPKSAKQDDIPVIDVSRWFETNDMDELYRLGAALRRASMEVGFYQLVGHEIPPVELNAILQQAKLFHSLPKDVKHALAMDMPEHLIGGVGYLGYDNWKLPSRTKPNRNAAYVVKKDHRISYDDNLWPEVLPGFRAAVERYSALAVGLAKRLLPIYAVALDLPADYFLVAFEEPFFRLRMTHYRPKESTANQDGEGFGIHPHVDTSFITLLLTDGTPGLNIFSHKRQEWIQMPTPRPNALIVNTGELLRQWSNNKFVSTRHFATNTTNRDRYSVPFFFTPNSDYVMECLPTCRGPDNPPAYAPFSYNQSQGVVQGEKAKL